VAQLTQPVTHIILARCPFHQSERLKALALAGNNKCSHDPRANTWRESGRASEMCIWPKRLHGADIHSDVPSPHSAFPRKISQQQHFTLCIRHTTLWAPFMVKTHTPFFDSARAFALTTLAAMLIPTVLQSSTNVSSRARTLPLLGILHRPNFHSPEQLSLF
jgi:hypothetical protein